MLRKIQIGHINHTVPAGAICPRPPTRALPWTRKGRWPLDPTYGLRARRLLCPNCFLQKQFGSPTKVWQAVPRTTTPQKVPIFAHGARSFALQKQGGTFRGPPPPAFRAASGRTHASGAFLPTEGCAHSQLALAVRGQGRCRSWVDLKDMRRAEMRPLSDGSDLSDNRHCQLDGIQLIPRYFYRHARVGRPESARVQDPRPAEGPGGAEPPGAKRFQSLALSPQKRGESGRLRPLGGSPEYWGQGR